MTLHHERAASRATPIAYLEVSPNAAQREGEALRNPPHPGIWWQARKLSRNRALLPKDKDPCHSHPEEKYRVMKDSLSAAASFHRKSGVQIGYEKGAGLDSLEKIYTLVSSVVHAATSQRFLRARVRDARRLQLEHRRSGTAQCLSERRSRGNGRRQRKHDHA